MANVPVLCALWCALDLPSIGGVMRVADSQCSVFAPSIHSGSGRPIGAFAASIGLGLIEARTCAT